MIIAKAVEGHDPGVARVGGIGPRNALVRNLFSNDRAPFFRLAADLHLPVEMGVVQLCHLLHTFHEAWEFLELCPLVVGNMDGHMYIYRLLDGG